jgi:hypothetical protein
VVASTDSGENSTVIFWYEAVKTEPLPLVTLPLNQRGWILQERILSPRTIHYTATQLVWESSIAFGLAWDYKRPGSVGDKPTPCLSRRRPTWSWASHDCVVKWPGAYDNFVTNQHFALVMTDPEFLGQNPGDFNPVTGGYHSDWQGARNPVQAGAWVMRLGDVASGPPATVAVRPLPACRWQ